MSESSQALSIFNPEHKITSPEQWTALVQATYAFLKSLAKVANVAHTWTPASPGTPYTADRRPMKRGR